MIDLGVQDTHFTSRRSINSTSSDTAKEYACTSQISRTRVSPSQRMMAQGTATTHVNSPASHVRSPAVASGVSPSQTTPKPKTAVTTFHDEFKVGFPSKSLSTTTSRWWGSGESDSSSAGKRAGDPMSTSREVGESVESFVDGTGEDDIASDVGPSTTASGLLVKTRKKAAVRGRSALGHAVTRKYGIHRLGAKDAATLKFVFGDHLPKQWKSAFAPGSWYKLQWVDPLYFCNRLSGRQQPLSVNYQLGDWKGNMVSLDLGKNHASVWDEFLWIMSRLSHFFNILQSMIFRRFLFCFLVLQVPLRFWAICLRRWASVYAQGFWKMHTFFWDSSWSSKKFDPFWKICRNSYGLGLVWGNFALLWLTLKCPRLNFRIFEERVVFHK